MRCSAVSAERCFRRSGRWRLALLALLERIGEPMCVKAADARPDDDALLELLAVIASGRREAVTELLDLAPGLARNPLRVGASRKAPSPYFLIPIRHYVYAGDTALHVAAATHSRAIGESLLARGAAVGARNRRGAEPLHYAADASPGVDDKDRAAQREMIGFLIDAGADPNSIDKSGVAPLHRAVRNRSAAAVDALIHNGADPLLANGNGSTPLHLAVQPTGKSNSGTEAARNEQRQIILMLLGYDARPSDIDHKGKTVAEAASSEWVRRLLTTA